MGSWIVGLVGAFGIGFLLFEGGLVIQALLQGSHQARLAEAYTQVGNGAGTMLVIGDSTGYGTGAMRPEESIAGRVGSVFPEHEIKNLSVNGLQTSGLLAGIRGLPRESVYDLALIQIGGNDILFFVPYQKTRNSLELILDEAKVLARHVVVMTSGNVGAAPAFGPLLSYLYSARTRAVREIFLEVTSQKQVSYVDLYEPRERDPFVQEPARYHSRDGLHPSSEGYALWFEKLKPTLTQIVK